MTVFAVIGGNPKRLSLTTTTKHRTGDANDQEGSASRFWNCAGCKGELAAAVKGEGAYIGGVITCLSVSAQITEEIDGIRSHATTETGVNEVGGKAT